MHLQARRMRRTKKESDKTSERSSLRLGLLALLAVALLLAAGCTTDADGNIVAPAVAPAPDGGTQPAMHRGVPVGFTEEGYPYRGDPNAAITIYEYSDYECPFCARHVIQTEPALLAGFGETGSVKFVFRDMPLSSLHANAVAAAIAANCVAEQDIVLFWQMHDQVFRTQKEWAPLEEALSFFAGLVQELGADTTQYGSCMANNAAQLAKVNESLAEAQSFGYTGTPSFRFVREETGESFSLTGAQPYDTFAGWIDTIASGGTPQGAAQAQAQPQQQQQGDGQLPFWATAEGLTPDPDRPGYTLAGDIYKGSSDAPIVIVEFSDFQCPYCSRHTLTTQPVLDQEFIGKGEVMWVFKHFPSRISIPLPLPPRSQPNARPSRRRFGSSIIACSSIWQCGPVRITAPISWSWQLNTSWIRMHLQPACPETRPYRPCRVICRTARPLFAAHPRSSSFTAARGG